MSERCWTGTLEMDANIALPQGSISSVSTSAQMQDSRSNSPPEFVNHGLFLWKQTRQQWLSSRKSQNRPQKPREPKLNWNATYASFLESNKPFQKPIPLAEMVDFLVDIWEQEGM